jgi:hypothetical protein
MTPINVPVTFTAFGCYDPEGDTVVYLWDVEGMFGQIDGITGTPTWTYSFDRGDLVGYTYSVRVQVRDAFNTLGNWGSFARIYIAPPIIWPESEVLDFDVSVGQKVYNIGTCSNSTVTDVVFNQTSKSLQLSVNGTSGTTGFCTVTVPAELMSGDFSLYLDDVALVESVDYSTTFNGTHYLFSMTYLHSSHIIEIVSTNIVPDFAAWLFLPFLTSAMLLRFAFRKRQKKLQNPN